MHTRNIIRQLLARSVWLAVLAFVGLSTAEAEDWYAELARHWAPHIFQDVDIENLGIPDCDNPLGRYDFIAAADFDHNDNGSDNWENAGDELSGDNPLKPYVYYSVIETQTHYYITYSLFHPRDWNCVDPPPGPRRDSPPGTHENDLEGATFVICKTEMLYGTLRLIGCICHNEVFLFKNANDIIIGDTDFIDDGIVTSLPPDSLVHYISLAGDERPCLFVESGGHGIGNILRALEPDPAGPYEIGGTAYKFKSGDGVLYSCYASASGQPTEPPHSSYPVNDAKYQLVPFDAGLWELRYDTGPERMFDGVMDTYDPPSGCPLDGLPLEFYAQDQRQGANPSWAWRDDDSLPMRGWWFLEPDACLAAALQIWPDRNLTGYSHHIRNWYRTADSQIEIYAPASGSSWVPGESMTIGWTSDSGQNAHRNSASLWITREDSGWSAGRTWEELGAINLETGETSWQVTGPASDRCFLAIRAPLLCNNEFEVVGYSAEFAINAAPSAPVVLVGVPNGGESWPAGSSQTIEWEATDDGTITTTEIRLSVDGGASYPYQVDLLSGNPEQYVWEIPEEPGYLTENARIKVICTDDQSLSGQDESDEDFAIALPGADVVTVTVEPNPGFLGSEHIVSVTVESLGQPLPNTEVNLSCAPSGAGSWSVGACGLACLVTDQQGRGTLSFWPSESGSIGITAAAEGGAQGHTTLYVQPAQVVLSVWVRLIHYGLPSRYIFEALLVDAVSGEPMEDEEVTLTTTKGHFEESGSQTYVRYTSVNGWAYGTIETTEWGEAALCCTPTEYPQVAKCITAYFSPYPPPPLQPFDNVGLNVYTSQDDYDHSGGLSWNPDGSMIAGPQGSTLKVIRYPEKTQLPAYNYTPHRVTDIAYSVAGDAVALSTNYGDDHIFVVNPLTGAFIDGCETSATIDIDNLSVDWTASGRVIVGRDRDEYCRVPRLRFTDCYQDECYETGTFPPQVTDVTRVRVNSAGRLAAVTSGPGSGGPSVGGALAVFDVSGSHVYTWPNQVPDENDFSDCDWLPGNEKVVAGGVDFAAVYTVASHQVQTLNANEWVRAVAGISPDSVAIAHNYDLRIQSTSGAILATWHSNVGAIVDLAYNPTRHVLAACGVSGNTQLFNLSADHASPLLAVPDTAWTTSQSGVVTVEGTVWDQTTDHLLVTATIPGESPDTLQIGGDGSFSYPVDFSGQPISITFSATDYYRQTSTALTVVAYRPPEDPLPPEVLDFSVTPPSGQPGTSFQMAAEVVDVGSGVDTASVWTYVEHPDETVVDSLRMYDDGCSGGDETAGDGVFSTIWDSDGFGVGVYYLEVSAEDLAGNTLRTENVASLFLAVGDPPVVEDFLADPPDVACGETVTFSARAWGVAAPIDTSSVWLFLERPPHVVTDSLRLYDDGMHGGDLVTGDSVFTGQWTALDVQVGTYYCEVRACDQLGTCIYTNGLGQFDVTTPCLADLTVDSISIDEDVVGAGGQLTVRPQVRNQGTASSPACDFYLYLLGTGTSADSVALGYSALPPLGIGESQTVACQMGVPSGTSEGGYRACVLADAMGEVPELDEQNNHACSDDSVTVITDPNSLWWDGFAPHPGGQGLDSAVRAFVSYEGEWVAGGDLTTGGGVALSHIGAWDGSGWHGFGDGFDSRPFALTVHDGHLVAGGEFTQSGTVSVGKLAYWDGVSWSSLGGFGSSGTVLALLVEGDDLYVGGAFTSAGVTPETNGIARWDGSTWHSVGGGLDDGDVRAMQFHDGRLFVAGTFDHIGGVEAHYIAQWDGTSWSAVGPGMEGTSVWGLAVYEGELIAGGDFNVIGSPDLENIARWDGTSWHAVGGGIVGRIRSLHTHGAKLIAGGRFTDAGGTGARYIARWDGQAWAGLGSGVTGGSTNVLALGTHEGRLFAGGAFTHAGEHPSNYIGRWDGDPLDNEPPLISDFGADPGSGPCGTLFTLTASVEDAMSGVDPTSVHLFVEHPDEVVVADLAMFDDGTSGGDQIAGDGIFTCQWSAEQTEPGSYWVEIQACDLAQPQNCIRTENIGSVEITEPCLADLIALSVDAQGREFVLGDPVPLAIEAHNGGTVPCPEFDIAAYVKQTPSASDSTLLIGLGTGGPLAPGETMIYEFAPTIPMSLSLGCYHLGAHLDFAQAIPETDETNNAVLLPDSVRIIFEGDLCWWDGFAPHPGGQGLDSAVRAFVSYEGEWVAGGDLTTGGGVALSHIGAWDGSGWHGFGDGFDSRPFALTVHDGHLVAGGEFTQSGTVSVGKLAYWDGVSWSSLGGFGSSGTVLALLVEGDDLYVGGAFTSAGVTPETNGIARWDGSTWHSVGGGLDDGDVRAMQFHDGRLFVAGTFDHIGGVEAHYIAQWDGTSWSAVGPGMEGTSVWGLAVYEGELIAGGDFNVIGSPDLENIARWDGTSWHAVGGGIVGRIRSLHTHGAKLIAGGRFTDAGGTGARYIARWDGQAWAGLGSGVTGGSTNVLALGTHEGRLFAGGAFTHAGEHPSNYIALWFCPVTGVESYGGDVVHETGLRLAAPNPFVSQTRLALDLAVGTDVDLAIYDPSGRLVRSLLTGRLSAGRYRVVWDGCDNGGRRLQSGLYYAKLRAGHLVQTQRIISVR